MKMHHIESSPMLVNTYILYDDTKEAAVIDPGFHNPKLFSFLKETGLNVKYIIATHGHGDHTSLMGKVKAEFGGDVVIHKDDAFMLSVPSRFSEVMGDQFIMTTADMLLEGGETLKVGDFEIKVLHTPGHSKGGVCFIADKYLITGDTLFWNDVGRTDFEGGSHDELRHSISVVLGAVEGDLDVLPGHEDFTTLAHEKANNPFFKPL